MSDKKYIKMYDKKIKRLENNIKHPYLSNIGNAVIQLLIRSGIAIDYAFPFILSSLILLNGFKFFNRTPFVRNNIIHEANVEYIDSSNGYHICHESFDFEYDDRYVEYSTGWRINDMGLYERSAKKFRVNLDDIQNLDEIFRLSLDELQKRFVLIDINSIQKEYLDNEDMIYSDDNVIIVINYGKNEQNVKEKAETDLDILSFTLAYLFLSGLLGLELFNFNKVFVKIYVRDKLKSLLPLHQIVTKKNLEKLKGILEVTRLNKELLSNDSECVYSYQLRKR